MTTITKKLQGNGQMSWIIEEKDENGTHMSCPKIVYEDPEKKEGLDISNINLKTLTPDQLAELAQILKPLL